MEQPQPTHRPWGLNKIKAIAAGQPSGAKALLSAVLELGLPYTMERDDILHGFIYGSEALVDQNGAQTFLQSQISRLQTSDAIPQPLASRAVPGISAHWETEGTRVTRKMQPQTPGVERGSG